jgi:hypothetical protein
MQQSINELGGKGLLIHKLISAIIFIGAVMIFLPGLLGMNNWITVCTAIIFTILMMISIIFHIRSREKPLILADIILMLLSACVAYGRWILAP